jgi:tRNA-specific 2-thiouridylase
LITATKKDSQGICFIGNVRMSDFLRAFVPDKPGPIKNLTGTLLGSHRGLHFYTLGQRRGIGVPSNTPSEAYVVVEKRLATNELIVAFDRPESRGLYASRCRIGSLSFTNGTVPSFSTIQVKPRYRARAAAVRFEALGGDSAILEFTEPQRALTPGQICALYDGETLLGGGVFEEIF